jgi:two-component system chemotaxis sensor kinase CheA
LTLTRAAFRQEADELLTELDAALLGLEAAPKDDGLVNRAFRATHTLKGGGATAGFDDVSALLHGVEDVFNEVREARIEVTAQLVDLALQVSDAIRRILQSPESESARIAQEARGAVQSLRALIVPGKELAKAVAAPDAEEASESRGFVYSIRFEPAARIFFSGNDPSVMLRDLAALGALVVRARVDALPPFLELDAELCALSWEVQLATDQSEASIRDVFLFVEDQAKVEIGRVASDKAWVLPPAAYFGAEMVDGFLEESAEDIAELEASVLALEANPCDAAGIEGLFRLLHNLKAQARLLLSDVRRRPPKTHPLWAWSDLCHRLESIVEPHRGPNPRDVDATTIQHLLQAVDWMKLLARDFVEARPALDAVVAFLAEQTAQNPAPVASRASPATGQGRPMLASVGAQCLDVLTSVLRPSITADRVTQDELKAMSRALHTLRRAAAHQSANDVRDKTDEMLEVCRRAAAESGKLTIAPLVAKVRTLEEELRKAAASGGAGAPRGDARTISLRPSKPVRGAPTLRGPAGATASEANSGARSIRVDQAKLDRLMQAVGELLVARNALPVLAKRLDEEKSASAKDLKEASERISHISADLQDTVMSVRMMPIRTVFQRFPRMLRDLARAENKLVQLIISGEETELDKTVLEQLGDPLIHLVRNAIDHGVEPPDDRRATGKPELGTIGLRVSREGSFVVISVSDDGRGMDAAVLREKAVEKGIMDRAAAAKLTREGSFDLIFLPGFSTAAKVTSISGRGVGMDVVRSNVRQLHGTVVVDSERGKGTTFVIKLPASLMVSKGMLIECAGEQYVLPIESIRETVKVPRSDIHQAGDVKLLHVRGCVHPVVSLAELLVAPRGMRVDDGAECSVAIVQTRAGLTAVLVDRLVSEIDVIVKPLSDALNGGQLFQGASVLGDGTVTLVIDPGQLSVGPPVHRTCLATKKGA